MALGTVATLAKLTNPERRPPLPREELCQEVLSEQRAGAVVRVGPCGVSGVSQNSEARGSGLPFRDDRRLFVHHCRQRGRPDTLDRSMFSFGNRDVPRGIIEGLRVGRLTALQKPDGGVRGIVVGAISLRLVARIVAKQVAKQAENAIVPFQDTISTKAGCECIAHNVQSLTDVDSNATIVSIDGVGACDLISGIRF